MNGAVYHHGDNLTGEGEGDDESIDIDLSKLPESVSKVLVSVLIYDANDRNQNFGQVENAFARVFLENGSPLLVEDKEVSEIRYDLTEDYSGSTSVDVVEFYRHNGNWKVKGIGKGSKDSIQNHANRF